MNTQELSNLLCSQLCASAKVVEWKSGIWRIQTPFLFPDGDSYVLYIQQLPNGKFKLSDMGNSLMHMSYESDIQKLRDGTRARLLEQILAGSDVLEDDGEFYVETSLNEIGSSIFQIGQALTKVHDLSFLDRVRGENTFYDDLRALLHTCLKEDQLHENYIVPDIPRAKEYPVDYHISGGSLPVYLFGVPNKDKAQLTTIILQYLNGAQCCFTSMIVFQDMEKLSRPVVSRLTNAANDQIASLDAEQDLRRKINQKMVSMG